MRQVIFGGLVVAGSVFLGVASAQAAGDAAAGKILFTQKCGLCHAPIQGQNKIGPSLWQTGR
jgi:cytochrome c2